jgi:hypothetical protein
VDRLRWRGIREKESAAKSTTRIVIDGGSVDRVRRFSSDLSLDVALQKFDVAGPGLVAQDASADESPFGQRPMRAVDAQIVLTQHD